MAYFANEFNYYPCYFCGRYCDDGGFIQYHGKTVKICPFCDVDDVKTVKIEEEFKCK